MEDIKAQLDAIEWDQSSMTANEYILKQIVEQLLLLHVEETKEIMELRQKLVECYKRNGTGDGQQNQNITPELQDFDPNSIYKNLRQIQEMIRQLREERENSEKAAKEAINTITQENTSLKEELNELYAKYVNPRSYSSISISPTQSPVKGSYSKSPK
ncbi:hypothetical protein TVAG_107360 [Trichomonas vaginalis G3]|uniref:Uncharacterized protein n=1 Tax=Trichomonas vaginalis (strain ATCC PRA-98 / G3) TaxID=412133 RepID=A2FSB5_TRIV3|nr:hypothetical protein TVAGG3_0093530 [Trichomonas vaginalis G3]EAX92202.1 hypothetical protein TVAG_107360 [Trichomonas vaginalis G3]KAI5543998.1 hypothetical protein TVAGG3_0093530 [Trichomonas vaginalis G3]|eukprot:XP_001305132.1 hypothetical protein [Trichomonas vaginalis G3]